MTKARAQLDLHVRRSQPVLGRAVEQHQKQNITGLLSASDVQSVGIC